MARLLVGGWVGTYAVMARVRAVGVCGLIFCGTPTGGVGARGPMREGARTPSRATEVEGHGGRNLDWVRGAEDAGYFRSWDRA